MSWGFSALLAKKGMDIVLPLIHGKGCLQTINQFISLRVGTVFLFSHYFSSFSRSIFISQALALHQNHLPSLPHHLRQSLLSSLLFISQTCVCSPSIIFYTLFPERRCMPKTETKRLWYKPGCVGRAPYLHIEFSQLVFLLPGRE